MDKYNIARVQHFIISKDAVQEIDYRVNAELPDGGFEWLHFDRAHIDAKTWLDRQKDIDPIIAGALLNEETRPRCFVSHKGILMNLRAIDFKQSGDPKDFISLRMWITPKRLVSFRKYYVPAIADALNAMRDGDIPTNVWELVGRLGYHLSAGSNANFAFIDSQDLSVLDYASLAQLRGRVIKMKQHLTPQQKALGLWAETLREKKDAHVATMAAIESMETAQLLRERLETFLSRAAVYEDILTSQTHQSLTRNTRYLLVLAALFLPLILITLLL